MTIYVPGWMQGGTYTAQQDRVNGRAADWDEGVDSRLSFQVAARAAGANMSVDVAPGGAVVTGDNQAFQGNYQVFSDAVVNLTGFTSTASNSRYDLVGIQINDPNAGGAAGSNAVITRVAGTPAASPVPPAAPASFLTLAIVGPFTTSSTSINIGMIFDAFVFAAGGGGPAASATARLLKGFREAPGASRETYNFVAPNGWLIEDGRAVSRTTYAALFEHLGVRFGAGDGVATFNIPDSRGRVFVPLDNQGGTIAGRLVTGSPYTLGATGGTERETLTEAQIPSMSVQSGPGGDPVALKTGATLSAGGSGVPNTATGSTIGILAVGSVFGANPITHMQPYLLGYRMIRT